jgi:hypothetical protein
MKLVNSLFSRSPLQKKVSLAFTIFSATALVAYAVYMVSNRAYVVNPLSIVSALVSVGSFTVIAALLSYRRPDNTISWILVVVALMVQTIYLEAVVDIILKKGTDPTFGLLVLRNLWNWLSALASTTVALMFVLFPDGQLPSPRWRPVVWLLSLQVLITLVRGLYLAYDLFGVFPISI